MRITNDMLKEINSNDGHVGIVRYASGMTKDNTRIGSTIEVLKDIGSKRIAHIGCCDHLINIDNFIKNKRHMHMRLQEHFDKLVGFDINQEAVEYLKTKGANNVYFNDVTSQKNETKEIFIKTFGQENGVTFLIPEVVEHTLSPVEFLKSFKKNYGEEGNQIVVSVPNAYAFTSVKNTFRKFEKINMDHKYTFTPTLIIKVMIEAGIVPENIYFTDLTRVPRLLRNPMLAYTLIVTGRL